MDLVRVNSAAMGPVANSSTPAGGARDGAGAALLALRSGGRACSLDGDFDGDGTLDVALLVQNKGCAHDKTGACPVVGIAFLLGNGKQEVLGAGRGRWRQVNEETGRLGPSRPVAADSFSIGEEDPWYWSVWRLTPQGPREPPPYCRSPLALDVVSVALTGNRSIQRFVRDLSWTGAARTYKQGTSWLLSPAGCQPKHP
jgi:hypothetical protein